MHNVEKTKLKLQFNMQNCNLNILLKFVVITIT